MVNVFSFLQESARLYPDKVFVIDRGTEFTFRDVYGKVVRLSEHIAGTGVKKGDRVLIYLDNSVEYILTYFAILRVNGIIVPVNKNVNADTVRFIISDTEPALIVTNSIFQKRLQEGKTGLECAVLNMDNLGDMKSVSSPITEELTGDGSLPALILYTSGTTRMPKGVTLTHQNLKANTESIIQYLKLNDLDSLLAIVNFGYSYGNSLLLTHTKAGAKIIIENRTAYPIKIIEQLLLSKPTGFSTVGSYINILLKQDMLEPIHLKALKYITFAGESTSYDDIMKLKALAPHLQIFVMYGQTEAAARLSYLEPDLLFDKAGSIGKAIPGVTLRVVTGDGTPAAPDEIGEIIATGENIMRGYWNNEAETAAVIKDGWLYTGDLAVMDEDGFLYIKGRKDDIIKYMGHRISPVEIEAAVNSCEHVLESAVVGVTVNGRNLIKAYIVPKSSSASAEEIIACIKKLLPSFKIPQVVELIEALPRTATGKIKRSELRK